MRYRDNPGHRIPRALPEGTDPERTVLSVVGAGARNVKPASGHRRERRVGVRKEQR